MSSDINVRSTTQRIIVDPASSSVAIINGGPPGPGGPQGIQGLKGDQGDPGPPLNMKGTVANSAALPSSGNVVGDTYQTLDTGNAWSWSGSAWVNTGAYRGPKGDTGDTGPAGPQGPAGTGTAFANNTTTILGTATLESVTPASLRASQTRLDVRSFGVVGDGVTNDTTAMQAALSSGQPIIVPKGLVVKVMAQLSIPSGLDLVLDGRVQRAWNGGAMFLGGSVNPTLIPINNVKIRGNGSVGSESMSVGSGQIFSGGFNDSVFEGFSVDTYWGGQAFVVAGDRLRMNRVTVKNSGVTAGTGGIRYYSGTDFVATACHVESGDDCIQFVPRETFTDPDIRRGAYIGCTGFSTLGRFIAVISAGTSSADIEDCSFIGCHGKASGRGIIVDLIESASGSVRRISIRDCSVDMTNDVTDLRGAVYIVDESTSPVAELRDIKLENVTILNPPTQAVSVETANFVSFEGCVIEPERSPFTYQFHVNNSDDFSMRNCIIGGEGTTAALRIAGLSERSKIENNTFTTIGLGYGILAFDSIDAVISGNKLISKAATTSAAGIRVESSAVGTRIERNDFMGLVSSLGPVSVALGGKVAFRENKGIDYLNPQSGTTYTVKATDNRRLIQMTNAGTKTVTLRLDTQETLPVSEWFEVMNAGAGLLTLSPVVGVTIDGTLTVPQGMVSRVTKTAANTYLSAVAGAGGTGGGGEAPAVTYTTQPYPPTLPAVGDIWQESTLDHSATWNGTQWAPVVPPDPELNICCVLGSFTMLLDSASYTSGSWENKGTSGAALDATLTGAALGTDASGRKYINFDGVDDYVDIPITGGWSSFTLTDSFTVFAIKETMIDNTGDQAVLGTRNNFGNSIVSGFVLARHANDHHSLRFGDGVTTSAASGAVTDPLGVRILVLGERNVSADNLVTWINETSGTPLVDNSTGTIGGGAFRLGRNSTGGTYHAMRGYVFGLARRVLTTAEKYVLDDWRLGRFS